MNPTSNTPSASNTVKPKKPVLFWTLFIVAVLIIAGIIAYVYAMSFGNKPADMQDMSNVDHDRAVQAVQALPAEVDPDIRSSLMKSVSSIKN